MITELINEDTTWLWQWFIILSIALTGAVVGLLS